MLYTLSVSRATSLRLRKDSWMTRRRFESSTHILYIKNWADLLAVYDVRGHNIAEHVSKTTKRRYVRMPVSLINNWEVGSTIFPMLPLGAAFHRPIWSETLHARLYCIISFPYCYAARNIINNRFKLVIFVTSLIYYVQFTSCARVGTVHTTRV